MTFNPRPTVEQPDLEAILEAALLDGENDTTDGCAVPEVDGSCQHGYPTWVRYLGLA